MVPVVGSPVSRDLSGPQVLLRDPPGTAGMFSRGGAHSSAEGIEMNGWPGLSTRPRGRLVETGVSLGCAGLKAPTSPKRIWLYLGFLPINQTEVM